MEQESPSLSLNPVVCLPNWLSPFLWGRTRTARLFEMWKSILALRRSMWSCSRLWTL